jgi:hypothetical protein
VTSPDSLRGDKGLPTPTYGCGVRTVRRALFLSTTCACTIHEAAATTGRWNLEVIASLGDILDGRWQRGCSRRYCGAGRPISALGHPGRRLPPLRVWRRNEAAEPTGDDLVAVWVSRNSMWFGLRSSGLGPTVIAVPFPFRYQRRGREHQREGLSSVPPAENSVCVMETSLHGASDTSAGSQRSGEPGSLLRRKVKESFAAQSGVSHGGRYCRTLDWLNPLGSEAHSGKGSTPRGIPRHKACRKAGHRR